ncbi:MAG: hypothetical protein ABIY39_07345, partial [Sphingomonas sp.]
ARPHIDEAAYRAQMREQVNQTEGEPLEAERWLKIEQADVADEIFTRLMGDVVEPRREFIQDNALSVVNLDV